MQNSQESKNRLLRLGGGMRSTNYHSIWVYFSCHSTFRYDFNVNRWWRIVLPNAKTSVLNWIKSSSGRLKCPNVLYVLSFLPDTPIVARFGPTAPLPVIHFPFHWPSSFAPLSMFNMPRASAVPAGLYNNALCGPQIFPHFQSGPLHYLPLPRPGPPAVSDCCL